MNTFLVIIKYALITLFIPIIAFIWFWAALQVFSAFMWLIRKLRGEE